MHDLLVALVSAAMGTGVPWTLRNLLYLLRGNAEREADRETSEIERLTARAGGLEGLVGVLRRLLDESLTRGNAATTMARILLFAVDQEPRPSAAMIAARDHAREVIAEAAAQIKRGGQ